VNVRSVSGAYASLALSCAAALGAGAASPYLGRPFADAVHKGGPQEIPGKVQCAYYDLGGEGVAYHTVDTRNKGSGALNPANGTYLNEFRMNEAIGTSYTKVHDAIDFNPYDLVKPPMDQLYIGWTTPGEWFNITVNVDHGGSYAVDLLYTSNRGGKIALDLNGNALVPGIDIVSTASPAEPIPWRQWHHWNVMRNIATVELPKGVNVLTVRIVTEGNMNLASLDFRPAAR
jgi:hypothetical protein